MTIATSDQRLRQIAPTRWRGLALDLSSVLALVVIVLAALGVAAWLLHADFVVNHWSGPLVGKFNGLIVLLLLGGAVLAGNGEQHRRIQLALALGGLALAGATVFEWLTGTDLQIDQAIVHDWVHVDGIGVAGRMALVGATGFCLLSFSLLLPQHNRRARALADILTVTVIALGLLSLVSLLLGITDFTLQTRLGPASVQSGLGMVLLGSAVFLRAHPDVLELLAGHGPDSRLARGALGATVVLPIVLGTLAGVLDRTGRFADHVDSALIVVGTIFVGGSVAMYASVLVSRHIRALEQALADQRTAERERRLLATIVETAGDAVMSGDLDGHITSWNAGAERLYGWTAEEAIGRDRSIIVPPERIDESLALTSAATVGVEHTEAVRLTKDGRRIQVSIAASPMLDDDGKAIGYSLIVRDISEQKRIQAELERARTELERSNRDLQDFASVASHDLQEPLRKIRAFADRLEHRLGGSLDIHSAADLARVLDAAGRMQQLIEDLLAFSRVTTRSKPFEAVDLGEVALAVLVDLETTIAASGGSVDVGPLPTIDADPLQMRQLLQNLIGNALKFHVPGRPPLVTVRATSEPSKDEAGQARLSWTLDVSDNGIGIDERHAERIFQPFERLHGRTEYPGTGMGLAICQRIAKRHGGSITASGTPGEGTTFHVVLPGSHSHDRSFEVAA
jgi:PAS domain S-box-containing protein